MMLRLSEESAIQTEAGGVTAGKRRRFAVVLNRESGTLRERWHEGLPDELRGRFAEHGVEASIWPAAPPELDRAIEEAIASQPDALVVGGGDGTVASTAKRLSGGSLPLGVLPLGTFNLAARDLGVPLEIEDAVKALATADTDRIDLLEIGERVCLCAVLLGFYPALAMSRREFHGRAWWRKTLGILFETTGAFRHATPLELQIGTDEGRQLRRRTRFVALIPGKYEDILSVIPKRSGLSEGLATAYISRHRSLPALARGSLAYVLGRLSAERDLERIQTGSELVLDARGRRRLPVMIDGEVEVMELPIRARLRKAALTVLRPGEEES